MATQFQDFGFTSADSDLAFKLPIDGKGVSVRITREVMEDRFHATDFLSMVTAYRENSSSLDEVIHAKYGSDTSVPVVLKLADFQ